MLFLASSFVMNCQRFEVENNREARESLFYTMTKSDDVDRYIDEEYIEDPGQFPVSPGDGCLKTLENDLIVETLVCQPGQSTYTIVNYNNVIVDLLNGQHYYYDVIDYELQ